MFGGALGNASNRWLSAKADIPMLFIFCFFLMGPIFSMRRRIEIGHLARFRTIVIVILHGPCGSR